MLVFMTHNTDFGDAFEREGDDNRYFDVCRGRIRRRRRCPPYALTH